MFAESRASVLLSGFEHGPSHPLLALTLHTVIDPQLGVFIISPYAGVCAAQMRATEWKACTPQELEQRCKALAASLLLTQTMFENLVRNLLTPIACETVDKADSLLSTAGWW